MTMQPAMRHPARRTRQGGFTLLEVLIALVVLSIGLLGLAALQATSLQFNQSANVRSQATQLAYDLADRMRANRDAALAGAYDGVGFAAEPPACAVSPQPGGSIANQDIAQWRNALACGLPAGTGAVTRNGEMVTITVRWDDSRGERPPEQFAVTTRL